MRSARLSPEESSAIAVVYTMFLAYVVFRDAKLRDFGKVIKNALKTLAIVTVSYTHLTLPTNREV